MMIWPLMNLCFSAGGSAAGVEHRAEWRAISNKESKGRLEREWQRGMSLRGAERHFIDTYLKALDATFNSVTPLASMCFTFMEQQERLRFDFPSAMADLDCRSIQPNADWDRLKSPPIAPPPSPLLALRD